MNKYIVFDFDGTLADTFELIKTIAMKEYSEYDVDLELFKSKGAKGLFM